MAGFEAYANSFVTSLAAAITTAPAAGTIQTITVAAAAPSALTGTTGAQFRVAIDSEILLVTSGANTTSWTAQRGAESSTTATHLINAPVVHVLTSAALANVTQSNTPRGLVVTPEQYGAKGDLTLFTDGAITAGSTTLTSSAFTTGSLPSGAGSKNVYVAWAGAGTTLGTTSAATGTTAITSIARTAGAASVVGPLVISSGSNAQLFDVTVAGAASAAITVSSAVPYFNFPSGSALSYNNAGLRTTVSSVGSGSATLAAAASQTVQNMVGWYGTDDTSAFLSALAAILAAGGGTLLLNNAGYLIDGAPLTTSNGNAILPLPLVTKGGVAIIGASGTSPASSAYSFMNAEISGTVIATTRTGDAYSALHGVPSMIGGPTYEGSSNSQVPQIAMVRMDDLTFLKPENPSIGTCDLSLVARTEKNRCYTKTAGQLSYAAYNFTATGGYGKIGQIPSNPNNFGFWMPDTLNFNASVANNCGAVGDLIAYVVSAHTVFNNCWAQFCRAAIGSCDIGGRATGVHANEIERLGIFACNYGWAGWDPSGTGLKSLAATDNPVTFSGSVSWEADTNQWGMVQTVLDDNGIFQGKPMSHYYASGFGVGPTPVSAPGLRWVDMDTTIVPVTYDDAVLTDTPLAYLPLNEPTATIVVNGSQSVGAVTSIAVTHGLDYTPTAPEIVLTPQGDTGAVRYWVSAVSATTFTITYSGTATAHTMGWHIWTPNARDLSGNGHSGVHTASPLLGLSGPLGGADGSVSYNGSTQYTTMDTLSTLGANLATATVEFCFRSTSTATNKQIMGAISSSSGSELSVSINQPAVGQTQFQIADNAGNKRYGHITTNIYDGGWHHIVWVVATTGTHVVYVDGISRTVTMDNTVTLTTMSNFTLAMVLGAENVNSFGVLDFAQCRLAKVAFYLTHLSQTRILAHWAALTRSSR